MTEPMIPNHKEGWAQLREILIKYPTHPLEFLGGCSSIIRGTWVVLFVGQVHTSPVSRYLEAWWPGWVWGILLILGGVTQIYALAWKMLRIRFVASLFLTALVATILVGYIVHDWKNIAVALYLTMLGKQLWITLRSRTPFNVGSRPLIRRTDEDGPTLDLLTH